MKKDAAAAFLDGDDVALRKSPRASMTTTFPRLGIVAFGEEFLGALDPGRPGYLGRDFRPKTDARPAALLKQPTHTAGDLP